MQEKENKRHVQLPINEDTNSLSLKEIFTYLSIRRYMSGTTFKAYPSETLLSELVQTNKKTLHKYITKLEKLGFFVIERTLGRSNTYIFNRYQKDSFECFSYDFLDNPDLSIEAKALYAVCQQYLFMDASTMTGVMNYGPTTLSKYLNISYPTIKKYEQELIDKGYLTIEREENKFPTDSTGRLNIIPKTSYVFNIKTMFQGIVFILRNHEARISKTESEIKEVKEKQREIEKNLL